MTQDFRLGDVIVEPRRNRIRRSGETFRLEPKVTAVLLHLASRPGEVIDRDSLLDQVWKDTAVVEKVLTRAISELRKALGDDPKHPRYIETILKGGYRLMLAPTPLPEAPSTAASPTVTDAVADRTPQRAPPPPPGGSRRPLAVGLAACCAVLVALAGLASLSSPTPRNVPDPIAPRPLTAFAGWEYDAAFSPDGDMVAFAWEGPDRGSWDIWLHQLGNDTPLRITTMDGSEGSPAWSPDGRRIALYNFHRDGEREVCAIWVVPSLGGAPRKLVDCAIRYPAVNWSPDGEWIVYNDIIGPGKPDSLFLLHVDSGERRPLTHATDGSYGDHAPAFSPDGLQIAFVRVNSEASADLYRIDRDGGEPEQLTFDARGIYGVDWAPTGRALVYSSTRGGVSELWRLDLAGGEADGESRFTRLVSGGRPGNPAIRADRMAWEQWTSETDLWTAEIGTHPASPGRPVASSTRWDLHPELSPDGARLAFSSDRSGTYEIWVAASDGADARRLTDFGGPFVGTPRWSPGGESLVFDARPGGDADLWIVNVDSGALRQLTTQPSDDLAASFSADGGAVYFTSNRGDGWQVWRIDVDGGDARQVTRAGGFGPRASSDGAWLYYAKSGRYGLWRQPVGGAGGVEEAVLTALDPGDWGNYAVAANGVYYVRRTPSRSSDEVVFHDHTSGRVSVLMTTALAVPSGDAGLSVSRDGSRIVFGQTHTRNGDLMLATEIDW